LETKTGFDMADEPLLPAQAAVLSELRLTLSSAKEL
jgi:hypothetical protein